MVDNGYLGNPRLKKSGVDVSYTEEQLIEVAKCADDPIYFIKNYVKIVNVDRAQVSEQHHQNRQTDSRLSGRHSQNEEYENLPCNIIQVM